MRVAATQASDRMIVARRTGVCAALRGLLYRIMPATSDYQMRKARWEDRPQPDREAAGEKRRAGAIAPF